MAHPRFTDEGDDLHTLKSTWEYVE